MTLMKKGLNEQQKHFLKTNTSLFVIVAAALLVELTSAGLYYAAQNIIQETMERLVQREMNTIHLSIRNQLTKVEVTVDNMAWVVRGDLAHPDTMYSNTRQLVEHNPDILGGSVTFVPDYYPQKGRWFEPYSARRADGTIETMQLGSAGHDYTQMEFYTETIAKDCGNWCEPYFDPDGAQAMVTTYAVPVHDDENRIVAVVDADISLDWLDEVIDDSKVYGNTQRFLLTAAGNLLAGEDNPNFHKALECLEKDEDKEGYVTMTSSTNEKLHVFYHPVGGKTDWILINVCEDDDIFGTLRHVRLFLLLLVAAGLLLIGFIVYRTSRNLEHLRQANAEKERIGGELHVASRIQQSMLPKHQLHCDAVDIYGSLVPAREVGGDLYDYFIRDEKLFFCIGDVSGKGAASAMLMGVTHALFRSISAHESDPSRIMHTINETSCQGNDSNMFVTLFIGVLDLPTGHLRYCNAGHDVPLVITNNGVQPIYKCLPHLPLGVFDDMRYVTQEMQILPDSTIFLYTDGLTEAKDDERRQFGLQRVEEELSWCSQKEMLPQQILEHITETIHQFVGDALQSDDLTMMAIRYTPRRFESILTETLVLKNDVHEVTRLSLFMKGVAEKIEIEKSLFRQLRLAVEEVVVNVIDYAYPTGIEGNITVRVMSDGHRIRFQIIDSGVPFDPTALKKTDVSLPAEDRPIGGLGIMLVRELMDSINYERQRTDGSIPGSHSEGQNVLTLTKVLKAEN